MRASLPLFLKEPPIKILIFIDSQTTLNKEFMWSRFQMALTCTAGRDTLIYD
jgi:hypothetical protein